MLYKNLGLIEYRVALALQTHLLKNNHKNIVLLCEHPPTFTAGRRGISDFEKSRLEKLGATALSTMRGGLTTFHGPGQLVVYPLLNLKTLNNNQGLGVRGYIAHLQSLLDRVCLAHDVSTVTIKDVQGAFVVNGNTNNQSIGQNSPVNNKSEEQSILQVTNKNIGTDQSVTEDKSVTKNQLMGSNLNTHHTKYETMDQKSANSLTNEQAVEVNAVTNHFKEQSIGKNSPSSLTKEQSLGQNLTGIEKNTAPTNHILSAPTPVPTYRKIGSIGVHIQKHLSMHGIALNCSTDVDWFTHINACGLDMQATSLSIETGRLVTVSEIVPTMIESFGHVFGVRLRNVSQYDFELDCAIVSFLRGYTEDI